MKPAPQYTVEQYLDDMCSGLHVKVRAIDRLLEVRRGCWAPPAPFLRDLVPRNHRRYDIQQNTSIVNPQEHKNRKTRRQCYRGKLYCKLEVFFVANKLRMPQAPPILYSDELDPLYKKNYEQHGRPWSVKVAKIPRTLVFRLLAWRALDAPLYGLFYQAHAYTRQ